MTENNSTNIVSITVEDELKKSYLDYAMSVIVGRALPDARDGLKPVHRRVLFAMDNLKNDYNKPYKKSARIVGDVIGKYHPHGDTAVYDTIVRMAQDFSMRHMLVDGQGNFGSVDGDAAAAMRYTEIRLSKIAHQLLIDLDKETVDFALNYDNTEEIPEVLPTRIPNLLVNGSSGIAVGMATNIPPHNLGEVIDGCLSLLDNPHLSIDELISIIPGPDFPTGGTINGQQGIIDAYKTGRGIIRIRAKHIIEEHNNRQAIIINEIPYQVNKAKLIQKIAQLTRDKKVEGISELRDESDKDGMRIVIELKRNETPEVIINNLYLHSQLQASFGINTVALVDKRPQILNLKRILEIFLLHREEVITRRTIFELAKARRRGHILEGLAIALVNIDPIIQLIKDSKTSAEAKEALIAQQWPTGTVMNLLQATDSNSCRPEALDAKYGVNGDKYQLSPAQAQAILDLKLHRLTGMEQDRLIEEYKEILAYIKELLEILNNRTRLLEIIKEELLAEKEAFANKRCTDIEAEQQDLSIADLIIKQEMIVTLSESGYVKTQPADDYKTQNRGGKGKAATAVKDEDFVNCLLSAHSHDTILCFSNLGRVYWKRVFEIPQASRTAKGKPISNLLSLDEGERITAMLPLDYDQGHSATDKSIFMTTSRGTVKKTALDAFARPRSTGLIAVNLDEGDQLISVNLVVPGQEIMLFSSSGKVTRFLEEQVRTVGRTARGVRGIRLQEGHKVISTIVPEQDTAILTVSANGFGKRTLSDKFPTYNRGGQGLIAMNASLRNGVLVGAVQVHDNDDVMLISDKGTFVKLRVKDLPTLGRNTQGVRLIKVAKGEQLSGVERIEELREEIAEEVASEDDEAAANE
jgi:DNA gyrase subunit A